MQQLAVLEVMDLPMDQVRFVLYDGGGPVRTSVAGGQTDFSLSQQLARSRFVTVLDRSVSSMAKLSPLGMAS